MIDEILKVVKIDLGQGTQSVEEYQKALDSAAKSADNLNDELGDLKKTSDGGILKGITAGFDEAVDATLDEIGKLDAEVAGLGFKIKDFAKVFKAFTTSAVKGMNLMKLAIAGTGIGLLIIAAATLYARWDEFKELIGLSSENIKKFKDMAITAFKNVMGAVVGLGSAIGASIVGGIKLAYNTIKDFGKEVTKLFKGLFDALANPANFTKIASKAVDAFTSTMKSSLSKSSKDLVDSVSNQWSKGFEAGANVVDKLLADKVEETGEKVKEKSVQKTKEIQDAILKETLDAIQYRYDYEEKLANATIDNEKQREERKFQIRQEGYQKQLEAYNEYLANFNGTAEEQAELEKERQRLIDQAYLDDLEYTHQREAEMDAAIKEQKKLEEEEALQKIEEDREFELERAELEIEDEQTKADRIFQIKQDALQKEIDLTKKQLQNADLSVNERDKLERKLLLSELKYKKQLDDQDKKYADAKKKRDKIVADAALSTSSSLFGSLSEIAGKESAAGKAFAVAQATIDTFKSANSAYSAMAGIPIVGPALGIAAAAAAIASGIVNVKNILATDAGDENSAPTSATSPNPSTPASVATPSVATPEIEQIGVTPLIDEFRDLQRMQSLTIGGDSGTRVYVLEEDIRNVGNRVQVRENEASF